MFEWFKGSSIQDSRIIETGLKAVDLFVPVQMGSDVLISGEPKAGARLLGNELAYRLFNLPKLPKAKTAKDTYRVMIYFDSSMDEGEACVQEFRESLPEHNEFYLTSSVNLQDIRQRRSETPKHKREAIFAFSTAERFVYEFRQAIKIERRDSPNSDLMTTFVVTESIVSDEYDAQLISSKILAGEGIYPALDLRRSSSNAFQLPHFPVRRIQIKEEVRRAVTEALAELVPGATSEPNWRFNQDARLRPAVQALRYLSQPYFVGEPYTGLKAAHIPLEQTIKNFAAIMAGRYINSPLSTFTFKNQLD